ncbi:hypothetical protein [Staphylococcus hominis]|uniref:hypothetical protein n=1 Tax=Staphylococcus hominis TaxID=1290 RepID=UPI0007657CBC|nr:hypothetical protein [Staphylococcus hominis]CVY21812.1 Uncharacterised protein [Staphylococcus hominis]
MRVHTVGLFTYPLTITYHVFDAINLKSVILIILIVLLQPTVIFFVKGVRLKNDSHTPPLSHCHYIASADETLS